MNASSRRRVVALLGCAMLVAGTQTAAAQEAVRVSASIELERVETALKRAARVFSSGFGRREAEAVAQDIDSLPAEGERRWTFEVRVGDRASTMQLRALLDNMSVVDLDFVVSPEVAPKLRKALDEATDGRAF